jgi:adenosine deaminase
MFIKLKGGFSDDELVQVQKNAVEICWANERLKKDLLQEIDHFVQSRA